MGVSRSVWNALSQRDILVSILSSILTAILLTDWFPGGPSIIQIVLGIAALVLFAKFAIQVAHSKLTSQVKAISCIAILIAMAVVIVPIEFVVQKHKRLRPATHLHLVTITWNQPAPISNGTLLSSKQLNATASAKGTFVYNPTFGESLNRTSTLLVTFLPSDPDKYQEATKTVELVVKPSKRTILGLLKPTDITIRACSTTLVPGNNSVKAAQRFVGPAECSVMILNNSKIMLKGAILRIQITPKRLKIETIPPATRIPSDYGSMSMIGETYQMPIPVTLVEGGATFPLSIQLPAFNARVEIQLEIIQDNGLSLGIWRVDLIPLHES